MPNLTLNLTVKMVRFYVKASAGSEFRGPAG